MKGLILCDRRDERVEDTPVVEWLRAGRLATELK